MVTTLAAACALYSQGVTIVMVTHDDKVASRSRKTLSIEDGMLARTL